MKTSLLCLVPLLSCAVAGPSFAADAGAKPGEPKPEAKARQEIRVITTTDGEHGPGPQRMMRRMGGPSATETVTFLGSETGPVSPTLAARLGLSEGTGRVVNQLVPAGRAAVLKPHDILPKLEDQILTEQRQLAALVRGHKESDEVTLTELRAGKQSTAKGRLAKREVPEMRTMRLHQPQPGPGAWARAHGPTIFRPARAPGISISMLCRRRTGTAIGGR